MSLLWSDRISISKAVLVVKCGPYPKVAPFTESTNRVKETTVNYSAVDLYLLSFK